MKLYLHFLSIHIKGLMQHKVSFLLTAIGQFLASFNVFLGVYFMMQRFHTVAGFTYSQVLMCFSIVLMSFTLAECFFRGFDTFSSIIANGEFDRILVRPKRIVYMVLCSKIELTRLGRLMQAVVIFVYAIPRSGILWTPAKAVTLVLMIAAGVLIFAGLFIIYASLCFFTLDGLEIMNIFTDGAREYGKYPVSIYGKRVLQFCTYLVPFALFQYYPFLFLLDRAPAAYGLLPIVSSLFLLPCLALWKLGVSRYKSTGS